MSAQFSYLSSYRKQTYRGSPLAYISTPLQKLLVVDDSAAFLELVVRILSRRGYMVMLATDGMDAISIAEAEQPDLIILDVQMPEMDGFDVLARLRRTPVTSTIPVIMMTGRREEADVRKAIDLGAQGYVAKPFDTSDLLGRIHRILNPLPTRKPG